MALHRYQKQYEGTAISSPQTGLLYLRAPFTGTIKSIYVWQSADSGLQQNIYNLSKNGVNQFSGAGRIIIDTDEDEGEKTGLGIAVTLGDALQLNLESVSQNRIYAPLVLEIEIEDGVSGANAQEFGLACSDEVTPLEVGSAMLTFRMPNDFTLSEVRANLNAASSSGAVQVDINKNGSSVLSTKLTIDQGEKTSVSAATPFVISDNDFADDDEITIDIDSAGTGATGLKVWLIGTRE